MISIEQLKDKYSGSKCVVIGNGPSLTLDIIKKIQASGIYSFVANGFCLIFEKTDYQPNAVCMSNYEAIRKFARLYSPKVLKFLKAGWHKNADFDLQNVYQLPFKCSHDLGTHAAPFIKDGNFTLDPAKENFCGDTVLLDFTIPMAFYMGFKEMYLIGVDCDYSKGYFSDKYTISASKNFRGMINKDYSIAIPSYRYVRDFLSSQGRRIYKITESKMLGFIETCPLERIFEKVVL